MAQLIDDDKDQKLNPGQADYNRKFTDLSRAEESGTFDDMVNNYDRTADDKAENANIERARQMEEAPGDYINNVKGKNRQLSDYGGLKPEKGRGLSLANMKALTKKRGIIGLIVTICAIGGIGFGGLFSGSGLLFNINALLKENIMDSVPAVFNVRGKQLLNYKLSKTTAGTCGSVITIRCRLQTMSDKQIAILEKENIHVETDGKNFFGRKKATALIFDNKRITADNLRGELKTNPKFIKAYNRAINWRLHAFSSSSALKWYGRTGLTRDKPLVSSTDEEKMKSSLREAVAGRTPSTIKASGLFPTDDVDEDGNKIYKDAGGVAYSGTALDDKIAGSNADLARLLGEKKRLAESGSFGKVAGSTVKGALLVGTGAFDNACTGWSIIRAAGFAAKYMGAVQLMRYANTYLATGDAAMAGDATMEEMQFLGNILTSENSAGISGTDSRGGKYLFHGDVTPIPQYDNVSVENGTVSAGGNAVTSDYVLTDESANQTALNTEVTNYVNGQITNEGAMAQLASAAGQGGATTDVVDASCGFIKSGWGQAIVIGGGVVALLGCIAVNVVPVLGQVASGGCFTANTAVQMGISATIAVTVAMLTPYLISLATDTLITGDENGNQAMNALVSGAGAMSAQLGLASGLGILSKKTALQFNRVRAEANTEFSNADRLAYSPFDASNTHTFMGQIVSTLIPYTSTVRSASSGLASTFGIISSSLASLLPNSYAKSMGDANVCPDPDLTDSATDINCNPLVGQSDATLNIDIDTAMDYMENSQMDPVTGEAIPDSDYAKLIKNCNERTTAIGAIDIDGGEMPTAENTGEICSDGSSTSYDTIRAYETMIGANEGSGDDPIEQQNSASPIVGAPSGSNGTITNPVNDGFRNTDGFGPRVPPCDTCSDWHQGLDYVNSDRTVRAISAGTVISISTGGYNNNIVQIKHADGLISSYWHMYQKDIKVRTGDTVTAGQQIGLIGDSGQAVGVHLHFELDISQVYDKAAYQRYEVSTGGYNPGERISPKDYFKQNGLPGY